MKINIIKNLAVLASLVVISGCAHNIQISPDLEKIRQVRPMVTIDKNVAYYISAANKEKEVTTPGGGGETVVYKPYADSEGALNTVLSNQFSRVYSLDSIYNKKYLHEKNISYIFIPEITTNSSSSSTFTWPPTEFTINLFFKALDQEGNIILEKDLTSTGNAEFSEFMDDFPLAARRSSELLFIELSKEISKEKHLFK
ncbi:MAG: hypothetical protein ACI9W6_002670 [Motiliproteus sp.]|jgi:hypothetical protein